MTRVLGALLFAGALGVPSSLEAITVTADDGRSLTTAEVCDARFLRDTPQFHRTNPTAVPGDERTRWAVAPDQRGAKQGEVKEWCVPSFDYFLFCFKDNEYYPRDAAELMNCQR